MSKPVVLLLVLVAMSGAALWGLTPADPPPDFALAIGREPATLDPADTTQLDEGRLILAVFEGLTVYNPREPAHPLPGMAERWQVSDDGLTYTFHIRPEARWSNGEPVTAEDFRYSWLRLLRPDPLMPYGSLLYCVTGGRAYRKGEAEPDEVGIVTEGARTLVVRLREPTPYFLDLTSFWPLAPVHRATVQAHGRQWFRPEHIVCNGAYVPAAWRFYQKLRLRRNPRYWDAANVRSETIDVLPTDSVNTAFLMYETGTVDLITSVPSFLLEALRDRPDFHSSPVLRTVFCRFNVRRPPFDDARVRRAFAQAVDRKRLVRTVTRAGERPARTFVPPAMPNFDPADGLPYHPEAARRRLAEAGYPGGNGFPKTQLLFKDTESYKAIAELLQACWLEELGVRVELKNHPKAGRLVRKRGEDGLRQYGIVVSNWVADYTGPSTFLDMFTTGNSANRTDWSHADYDATVRAAHAENDPERRRALWRQAERILVEQALPILPLYFGTNTNMYRTGVRGVVENIRNIHPLKFVHKADR